MDAEKLARRMVVDYGESESCEEVAALLTYARALIEAEKALADASCDPECEGNGRHSDDCHARQVACRSIRSLLEKGK